LRVLISTAVSALAAMIFTGGTAAMMLMRCFSIIGGSRLTAAAIVSLLPSAKHGDLGR
jgi:hypothetical protein